MWMTVLLAMACGWVEASAAPIVAFQDDFSTYGNQAPFSGNAGWTAVVANLDGWNSGGGTVGPATNNWGNVWGLGTLTDNHLVHSTDTWSDFTLDLDLLAPDDDSIGVVFRYQDINNFYVAYFSRDCHPNTNGWCDVDYIGGRVLRVQNGAQTIVASTTATHQNNVWHDMRVVARGSNIEVSLDGTTVMTGVDNTFASGQIGLFAYSMGGGRFDNVQVILDDTDDDTIPDVDDNCPNNANTGQADLDGDGLGNPCDDDDDGDGLTAANDCDDRDASVGGPSRYYTDADGDGFGDPAAPVDACTQPTDAVVDRSDCDDTAIGVNPDADELCNNGLDDDCSGRQDDAAIDAVTWYADVDVDGFGDPNDTAIACVAPSGFVADDEDCDDSRIAVNPDADELCGNGLDDDCSGQEDDGAVDPATFFRDGDGDGFGDANDTVAACTASSGYVADDQDCDDGDAAIRPTGTEVCDGADNDCNGQTDESTAIDASYWYLDQDEDGAGDDLTVFASCGVPSGAVTGGGDCDDSDPQVLPGAPERCNLVDDDCNGTVDDNVVYSDWFADDDGDGFGDGDAVNDCVAPSGYVDNDADCDDADDTVFPGAPEVCDGLDNDCDGQGDGDACIDTDTDVVLGRASSRTPDDPIQKVEDRLGGCACRSSAGLEAGWWVWIALAWAVRRPRAR